MIRSFALFFAVFAAVGVTATLTLHRYHPGESPSMARPLAWLDRFRPKRMQPGGGDAASSDLASLREAESRLWQLSREGAGAPGTSGGAGLDARIIPLVEKISSDADELAGSANLPQAEVFQAHLVALRAQFLGAQCEPARFEEPFLTHAGAVVALTPGSETAAQADMLRFLYLHPLDRPIDPQFLQDVDSFARTHKHGPTVFLLYEAASTRLTENGQAASAKALLKHGLKIYENTSHVSQLVNLLVRQGHAPPATPQVTEASLRARFGMLERGQSGRDRGTTSPPSPGTRFR